MDTDHTDMITGMTIRTGTYRLAMIVVTSIVQSSSQTLIITIIDILDNQIVGNTHTNTTRMTAHGTLITLADTATIDAAATPETTGSKQKTRILQFAGMAE